MTGTNEDFAERTHSHEQRISGAIVFFFVSGANLEHFTALNCVTVYARYCGMNVLACPKVITIIVKFVLLALAVLIQMYLPQWPSPMFAHARQSN